MVFVRDGQTGALQQRKAFLMCDYSLEHVASRPATVNEEIVTSTFPATVTRGFAGTDDPNTAVCLRPGTEIAFKQAPRYTNPVTQREQTASGVTARFRQIDRETRHVHHDALEFGDGLIVPLARLVAGQHAVVLQVPSVPLYERQQGKAEGAGISAPATRETVRA